MKPYSLMFAALSSFLLISGCGSKETPPFSASVSEQAPNGTGPVRSKAPNENCGIFGSVAERIADCASTKTTSKGKIWTLVSQKIDGENTIRVWKSPNGRILSQPTSRKYRFQEFARYEDDYNGRSHEYGDFRSESFCSGSAEIREQTNGLTEVEFTLPEVYELLKEAQSNQLYEVISQETQFWTRTPRRNGTNVQFAAVDTWFREERIAMVTPFSVSLPILCFSK